MKSGNTIQHKSTLVNVHFQLVVLIGIRRLLACIFSENELKILDDVLPSFKRSQQLDVEDDESKAPDTVSLRY